MWAELKKQPRDVVFNLCQYGMGEVWKWGGQVGHCWRTTGDLGLEKSTHLPGFYSIGRYATPGTEFAGPGLERSRLHPHRLGRRGRPWAGASRTPLTPDEQYAYMSIWC